MGTVPIFSKRSYPNCILCYSKKIGTVPIFIGLGSNLGNRYENIKTAIAQISENVSIIKKSSIY